MNTRKLAVGAHLTKQKNSSLNLLPETINWNFSVKPERRSSLPIILPSPVSQQLPLSARKKNKNVSIFPFFVKVEN